MSAIPHIVVCGRRYSKEEWEAEEAALPRADVAAHVHAAVERAQPPDPRRGFDGLYGWARRGGKTEEQARKIALKTATKHDRRG